EQPGADAGISRVRKKGDVDDRDRIRITVDPETAHRPPGDVDHEDVADRILRTVRPLPGIDLHPDKAVDGFGTPPQRRELAFARAAVNPKEEVAVSVGRGPESDTFRE